MKHIYTKSLMTSICFITTPSIATYFRVDTRKSNQLQEKYKMKARNFKLSDYRFNRLWLIWELLEIINDVVVIFGINLYN